MTLPLVLTLTTNRYNLGLAYENGKGGMPQDDRKALEYYEMVAEKGDVNAQFKVGYFYDQERGGIRDRRKAAEWLAYLYHSLFICLIYLLAIEGIPEQQQEARKTPSVDWELYTSRAKVRIPVTSNW